MNEELMKLRGEYVTLETEKRKQQAEIRALASQVLKHIHPFKDLVQIHFIQTPEQHLESAEALIERLKTLIAEHQHTAQRITEIKPMTGL